MKISPLLQRAAASAALFTLTASASAVVITLDFEGLENNENIEGFYNGGTGSNGSVGPNLGIGFSDNALAIIDADAGGTGNFGGEPSPDTVLYFLTGAETFMNVFAGFDTGFSFYYSAVNQPGFLNVYDALNGAGNILATLDLPITPSDGGDPNGLFSPFFPVGVAFDGTAYSVGFGGVQNQIGFDNITFGSAVPTPPRRVSDTGSTILLIGAGMLGMLALKRRSK